MTEPTPNQPQDLEQHVRELGKDLEEPDTYNRVLGRQAAIEAVLGKLVELHAQRLGVEPTDLLERGPIEEPLDAVTPDFAAAYRGTIGRVRLMAQLYRAQR